MAIYLNRAERPLPWNLLRLLSTRSALPWVIISDFNGLLWIVIRGKLLGILIISLGVFGRQLMIVIYQMLLGQEVEASHVVEERLDRAMGAPAWHECFPNAKIFNLLALVSDHNLIMLKLESMSFLHRHKRFEFENKCFMEKDLSMVVGRSWGGFTELDILNRLNATSDVLFLWGKHIDTVFRENKNVRIFLR
ncbi:hypothetical protein ACS0TY_034972 [Phlomoides rotata]